MSSPRCLLLLRRTHCPPADIDLALRALLCVCQSFKTCFILFLVNHNNYWCAVLLRKNVFAARPTRRMFFGMSFACLSRTARARRAAGALLFARSTTNTPIHRLVTLEYPFRHLSQLSARADKCADKCADNRDMVCCRLRVQFFRHIIV